VESARANRVGSLAIVKETRWVHLSAEDPDSADNEQAALDILTREAHGFAEQVRRRLEDAGLDVKEFSAKSS